MKRQDPRLTKLFKKNDRCVLGLEVEKTKKNVETWKGDFKGSEDAIFNNISSTFNLIDLTHEHYLEHLANGDKDYSPYEWDQPIFYDWYTQPGKYFYLSKKDILDPEKA